MHASRYAKLLLLVTGAAMAQDSARLPGQCDNSLGSAGYDTRIRPLFNNVPSGAQLFIPVVTCLNSNTPFQSTLDTFSAASPLGGGNGFLVNTPNFNTIASYPSFQSPTTFPLDLATGVAGGPVPLSLFGSQAQGQTSIDQVSWIMKLGFTDPFNFAAQNLNINVSPTNTITPFIGTEFLGGDPFATGSGEQLQTPPPDLVLNGPFPVIFSRYYASYLAFTGITGALGNNWLHNYDVHLYLKNGYASVLLADGTNIYFKQSGGGYQPLKPLNFPAQLVSTSNGYRFLDASTNLIYALDNSGALIRLEDRNGNGVDIQPGPNGPMQVSDGLGRLLVFSYTGTNLASVKDGSGRVVQFTQTGANLTKVTDADGKSTQYAYTAASYFSGLLTGLTLPRANKILSNAVYDVAGRVVQQTDSRSHITSVAYASSGTTIKDPVGDSLTHQYQNTITLTGVVDGLGDATSFTRDALNRITSITDRNGGKTAITYDSASGYIASATDPEGNVTRVTYQSQAQGPFTFYVPVKVTYADNSSDSFTYDASGNVLTSTDRAGNISKYTYNSRGQVLTATNPAAGITTYTYGNDGTLASVNLPSGNTTALAYDAQFRVKQVTYGDGSRRAFSYDNRGNLVNVTDELGQTITSSFDDNGNFSATVDALGAQTRVNYNTDDNIASINDAAGATTTYAYNDANYITGRTNGAGESVSIQYDAAKRISAIKDSAGKGASFTYDKEGAVTSVADALNRSVKFTRNKDGLITRATSPAGENLDLSRDPMGRVTSVKNPLNAVTTYGYDSRGLLTSITAPGGIRAGIGHDPLGLVNQLTDPNGNAWSFSNDAQGRLTATGDPLGGVTSYQYDQTDLLAGGTTPVGSFTMTRDAAGRAIQRAYSDGTTIAFTRDAKGRITGATNVSLSYDAVDRITGSNGLAMTYTAAGRLSSVTYAPGQTATYTYTTRGLLDKITDWAGGTVSFAYNDASQVISLTRSNGVVTQYSYDTNGRLSSIVETGGGATIASTSIKRDAVGRITATDQSVPLLNDPAPGVLQLGYDNADQVSGSTYDGLGRLNNDALRSYTWDLASRLTSYSGADGSAAASYDDAGLRISRTDSSGNTRNYVWNYATTLPTIATVQSGGADLRYYVYTPAGSLLYSMEAADSTRHFYHFDPSGSTLLLTDDGGNTTDAYAITPYGESVAQNGSSDNPFTWLGQLGAMQEGNTSLFYLRMRYYDSATGRFLSRDPLSSTDPLEINPYQYARGNPVTRDDPSGLATFFVTDQQPLVINGSAVAVWETVPGNPYSPETGANPIFVPFVNDFANNLPGPGTATVNLSFAPVPTGNSNSSSSLAIPRFCDSSTANDLLTVNICRTSLLYPYVTNQAGFDTSPAISNTTIDPFGTGAQCGSCTLNWYSGPASPGTPATPGPKPGKNFQNYMNAISNFQYAHGFTFVSDVGARNLAMGYLGIMMDLQNEPNPFHSEVQGH
jgi:RHS repeat-associated protein